MILIFTFIMYVFWATALMKTLVLTLNPAFARPSSGSPLRIEVSYLYT